MKRDWIWTEAGLKRLGAIIRRSREAAGLDQRTAASFVTEATGMHMSHAAIGSAERASVRPDYNTLAAIAASGFVKHNGRTLDIFDFIAIASESDLPSPKMEYLHPLGQLIEACLKENNWTLEEFSQLTTYISPSEMHTIMQGGVTKDHETNLRLICGHLRNPLTKRKFRTLEELLDYCGMNANNWQQDHYVKMR